MLRMGCRLPGMPACASSVCGVSTIRMPHTTRMDCFGMLIMVALMSSSSRCGIMGFLLLTFLVLTA